MDVICERSPIVVDQYVLLSVVFGVLVVKLNADEPNVAKGGLGHPDVLRVGAEHARHAGLRELAVRHEDPVALGNSQCGGIPDIQIGEPAARRVLESDALYEEIRYVIDADERVELRNDHWHIIQARRRDVAESRHPISYVVADALS